jgi:uncharacterized protein
MARYDAGSRDMIEIAEQTGAPDALFELGLMYCSGREVDLDMIEAHKWFNIAALSSEMSKGDIGLAQKRAREWLSRH